MKRMGLIFAVLVVVVGISLLALIIGGQKIFTDLSAHEKAITDIIFAILELFVLVLALILLHRYFRYLRPHWFVFEGFSNEAALQVPVNLGMLAREILKKDVDELWNGLVSFFPKNDNSEASRDDVSHSGSTIENDLSNFLTSFQMNDSKTYKIAEFLESFRKNLKDQSGLELMRSAGDLAPEDMAHVMKLINAIFPPRVFKAVGYLQCQDNTPGITFEIVDLGEQRELNICTIWEETDKGGESDEERTISSSGGLNGPGNISEDIKGKVQPEADTANGHKTGRYIELLPPTMRWLVLELWKQKMTQPESSTDRIFAFIKNVFFRTIFSLIPGLGDWKKKKASYIKNYLEKRKSLQAEQRVRLYLLLGVLYYASANKFEKFDKFFSDLAINHIELVIKEYEDIRPGSDVVLPWYSPYLYLASIYYDKLIKMLPKGKEAMCRKLLNEILNVYEEVLRRPSDMEKVIQYRIKIHKAIAKANVGERLGDQQLQKEAEREMQEIKKEKHPNSSVTREEYALYEYDLASWYSCQHEREARTHLGHSLILSKYPWKLVESNKEVKDICGEYKLKALKKELDGAPTLINPEESGFDRKMDGILDSVDW